MHVRLAVNLLFDTHQTTGAGLYGYQLAVALAVARPDHEVVAYVTPPHRTLLADCARWQGGGWPSNLTARETSIPTGRRSARRFWEQLILPIQLRRGRFDAVHSIGNTGLLICPCRQTVTVLDLTSQRYPHLRFGGAKTFWYRLMMPLTVRQATAVIALSSATASDVVRMLDVPPLNVHVIPPGGPIGGHQQTIDVPAMPYILAVGTQEPIKNHAIIVRALALLRADVAPALRLIIAGPPERATAELAMLTRALGLDAAVVNVGYVDGSTLATLYAHAVALVYPSLHEGFGLPPLEAMAAGTPVICANRPALPDTSRGGAILVNPTSALEIADAVARLMSDSAWRRHWVIQGHTAAMSYTWAASANQLWAVIERSV